MGLADLVRNFERALLPVLPRSLTLWFESQYFRRFGEAELALLPRLARRDWDAVDIGGHEGAYSLLLRKLVRRVHVFEPIPWMAALLRQKFGKKISIHEEALSSSSGQATLRFPRQWLSDWRNAALSFDRLMARLHPLPDAGRAAASK